VWGMVEEVARGSEGDFGEDFVGEEDAEGGDWGGGGGEGVLDWSFVGDVVVVGLDGH